jgi:hypothetical protein
MYFQSGRTRSSSRTSNGRLAWRKEMGGKGKGVSVYACDVSAIAERVQLNAL